MADFLPVIPWLFSVSHVLPSGYVPFLLIPPSSFLFSLIFSLTLLSLCLFSHFANYHLISVLLSISFSLLKWNFNWHFYDYPFITNNWVKIIWIDMTFLLFIPDKGWSPQYKWELKDIRKGVLESARLFPHWFMLM